MPEVVEKIKMTREYCDKHKIRQGGIIKPEIPLPPFDIQVDGGINLETAKVCVDAGANVLVSGDYLFKQPDMKKTIENLRNCVK